jgi:hypothetical protein
MPAHPTLVLPPSDDKVRSFRPYGLCTPSVFVAPIAVAAGSVLTAASVTAKAAIDRRANVQIAAIEGETARREIEAETERTRIREAAETERERIRQQSPPPARG